MFSVEGYLSPSRFHHNEPHADGITTRQATKHDMYDPSYELREEL